MITLFDSNIKAAINEAKKEYGHYFSIFEVKIINKYISDYYYVISDAISSFYPKLYYSNFLQDVINRHGDKWDFCNCKLQVYHNDEVRTINYGFNQIDYFKLNNLGSSGFIDYVIKLICDEV